MEKKLLGYYTRPCHIYVISIFIEILCFFFISLIYVFIFYVKIFFIDLTDQHMPELKIIILIHSIMVVRSTMLIEKNVKKKSPETYYQRN